MQNIKGGGGEYAMQFDIFGASTTQATVSSVLGRENFEHFSGKSEEASALPFSA